MSTANISIARRDERTFLHFCITSFHAWWRFSAFFSELLTMDNPRNLTAIFFMRVNLSAWVNVCVWLCVLQLRKCTDVWECVWVWHGRVQNIASNQTLSKSAGCTWSQSSPNWTSGTTFSVILFEHRQSPLILQCHFWRSSFFTKSKLITFIAKTPLPNVCVKFIRNKETRYSHLHLGFPGATYIYKSCLQALSPWVAQFYYWIDLSRWDFQYLTFIIFMKAVSSKCMKLGSFSILFCCCLNANIKCHIWR